MSVFMLKKIFFLHLFLYFLSGCFFKKNERPLLINGAGASFPYILYSKWLSEYKQVDPSVSINYQSIGSGGGVRQFLAGTLDFGGTDVPVLKKELSSTKKTILHIPTTLGAVTLTYNLPIDKKKTLRMDAHVLSQIFTGKIRVWNDSQIQKINPEITFPEEPLVVIYRADGSGTTSFFTNYLALNSKDFLNHVGYGKSVAWPVGIGGKGNEGVMGLVTKIKGSIAYLGTSYAISQNLPSVHIKNKTGHFVAPFMESIKAAGDQAMKEKKPYTASLIDIKGTKAYPMSGFSYIIISKKMERKKGEALLKFLKWILGPGQNFSKNLYFIPLPESVKKAALETLSQVELE